MLGLFLFPLYIWLNNCYINQKVEHFQKIIEVWIDDYKTERDYLPFEPSLDIWSKALYEAFSTPENCIWCDEKDYSIIERIDLLFSALPLYTYYYKKKWKERIFYPLEKIDFPDY